MSAFLRRFISLLPATAVAVRDRQDGSVHKTTSSYASRLSPEFSLRAHRFDGDMDIFQFQPDCLYPRLSVTLAGGEASQAGDLACYAVQPWRCAAPAWRIRPAPLPRRHKFGWSGAGTCRAAPPVAPSTSSRACSGAHCPDRVVQIPAESSSSTCSPIVNAMSRRFTRALPSH
jgi:hypothetical protein